MPNNGDLHLATHAWSRSGGRDGCRSPRRQSSLNTLRVFVLIHGQRPKVMGNDVLRSSSSVHALVNCNLPALTPGFIQEGAMGAAYHNVNYLATPCRSSLPSFTGSSQTRRALTTRAPPHQSLPYLTTISRHSHLVTFVQARWTPLIMTPVISQRLPGLRLHLQVVAK